MDWICVRLCVNVIVIIVDLEDYFIWILRVWIFVNFNNWEVII